MQIKEIAFTAYSVTDMKRARDFYEGVLGLKKSRGFGQDGGEESWIEYDLGAGCLALVVGGEEWPPSPTGTAAALEVDDFDGFVAKLKSSGAKFIVPPQDTPVCRMVVIADPDGNRIVLHQRKTA
jgi:predicted enzyme related to lactoylglutathione lyase